MRGFSPEDIQCLEINGIYIEPASQAGPVLVFPISDGEGGEIRVLWQNGIYESATYTDSRRDQLVFSYLQFYDMIFDLCNNIKRVAMLGGGGCSYPRYLIVSHPEVFCDVVEVDESIAQIARKWFFVDDVMTASEGRLSLQIADGITYIEETAQGKRQKYDAVLNDCFLGSKFPQKMTTTAWMQSVAESLNAGGVYLVNVVASQTGELSDKLTSIVQSAQKVFSSVRVIPTDEETDQNKADNLMVVCQK